MNHAIALLLLFILGCPVAAAVAPDQPEASADRSWIREHLRIKNLVKLSQPPRAPALYFLGDSITAFWPRTGKDSWRALIGQHRVLNASVSGDTTQNLLYRIQNGAFEKIQPGVVVLMAGINNLGLSADLSPEDLSRGIGKVVETLQTKSPSSRILLLSILPSSAAQDPIRARIRRTNLLLARLADRKTVFYLDVHDAFLDAGQNIPAALTLDGTHPSAAGYRVLGKILGPHLERLLVSGG